MKREFKTNIERLAEGLKHIETEIVSLLFISKICERQEMPGVLYISSPYYWSTPTEEQLIKQLNLLPIYKEWKASFDVLFSQLSPDLTEQIKEIDECLEDYIVQYRGNERRNRAPSSIPGATAKLDKYVKQLISIINLHKKSGQDYIIVPDVNSIVTINDWTDYQKLVEQERILIILTPTVLAELDSLKVNHRNPEFKEKAKKTINKIKGLKQQGSLLMGVTYNRTIKIRAIAKEPNFDKVFSWLDESNNDDRIIASAVEIQKDYPSDLVIVVSGDINLQNKAELAYLNYADPEV